MLESTSDISSFSSSRGLRALLSFLMTGADLTFTLRPWSNVVKSYFWLLSSRCTSCILKILRSSSHVRFFRSWASLMVVVLGFQILGMLSNNFRIIWALKKLCLRASNPFRSTCIQPNMSSNFHLSSWWKIYINVWGRQPSCIACLHFPCSWWLQGVQDLLGDVQPTNFLILILR